MAAPSPAPPSPAFSWRLDGINWEELSIDGSDHWESPRTAPEGYQTSTSGETSGSEYSDDAMGDSSGAETLPLPAQLVDHLVQPVHKPSCPDEASSSFPTSGSSASQQPAGDDVWWKRPCIVDLTEETDPNHE